MSIDPGAILFVERDESVKLELFVVVVRFCPQAIIGHDELVSGIKPFPLAFVTSKITTCDSCHEN
jgi:hypothetical protein